MVVLHVSPIHLFLGADTVDILLDIGISVTSAILVGIARVVRIQAVGNLPLIRHTVAICIYIRLHLLIFRESTNLADVCDDTQLIGFLVQTAVLKTAIFSLRLVSQSPEVAVWILLRQFLYIVSLTGTNLFYDALVHDIAGRNGCTHILKYLIKSLVLRNNGHVWHGEWFVRTHQSLYICRYSIWKILISNLNTAVPVILGYSLVAFYDISFSINTTILSPREEFVASAFALHDTVADGTLRSKRSWLIIVVDEVAHG